MSATPISTTLRTNLARLRALDDGDLDSSEKQTYIDFVIDDTFDIGLACELDPGFCEQPELRAYLDESNRRLHDYAHRVQVYVDRTRRRLGSTLEDGEYKTIARRRSAIEFLKRLSSGTAFDVDASLVTVKDVDDAILAMGGGYLEPEEIPVGIPARHWWWWHPATPTGADSA